MIAKHWITSSTSIVLLLLSGCSTVIVERSSAIASTGSAYAATLQKVNEFALNESINNAADALASTPVAGTLRGLNDTANNLKERQRLVQAYGEFLNTLAEYFANLEAFAKYDAAGENSKAIDGVVDKLNSVQKTLRNTQITAEKKTAISGIVGLVSKQVHASALKARLEKDALPIATALALSSAALEQQVSWVEKPIQLQRDMDWARNVVQPYVNPTREQPLTAAWKTSFVTLIKQAPTVQLLVDAKAAGEKMEAGWRDVLRGNYSLDEVRKSLADIQSALDVLITVKAATK